MRIGPTRRVKPYNCPWCNNVADAAVAMDYEYTPQPEPDDFSFCLQCGEVSVYTRDGKLRKPTEEETLEVATRSDLRFARASWIKMKESKP